MQKVETHLCKKKVDVEKFEEEIEKFKLERLGNSAEAEEVSFILWIPR